MRSKSPRVPPALTGLGEACCTSGAVPLEILLAQPRPTDGRLGPSQVHRASDLHHISTFTQITSVLSDMILYCTRTDPPGMNSKGCHAGCVRHFVGVRKPTTRVSVRPSKLEFSKKSRGIQKTTNMSFQHANSASLHCDVRRKTLGARKRA